MRFRDHFVSMCLVGVLLVGACGCSSDDDPAQPLAVPAGRIQGMVRTGEASVDARIRATRIPDEAQAMAIVEVESDSSGLYSLDVPAGRYLVAAELNSRAFGYRTDGLGLGYDSGDTLVVDAHSPLHADFHLSSLELHFDFPPSAEGVTVRAVLRGLRGSFGAFQTTVSNGTADVTISSALPGTYKVEVVLGRIDYACIDCSWDGEYFWIPGERDSTAAQSVELVADHTSTMTCRIDTEPGRIAGEIGGPWIEAGLSRPAVALISPDSVVVRGFRDVNEDGGFEAVMVVPGPVKLVVEHFGVKRWVGGDSFETARTFLIENGQTISDVRFDESLLALDFLATGLSIGQPDVFVHDRTTMEVVAAIRSVWMYGSTIAVPNLPVGEYLVHIDTQHGYQPWIPQWYDRASRPEDAQIIVIPSDGTLTRVPVTVEAGGRIVGQIGNAPAGAEYFFYLTRADDLTRWALGFGERTSQAFDFEGIPDGDWKVGAWPNGGGYPEEAPPNTVWYPSTLDWGDAGTVSIRDGSTVTGILITLP